MARPTEKPKTILNPRREIPALVRFLPWVLLSLLFVLMVWHTDIAALSGLFQSSPVRTATVAPPPSTPTSTATDALTPPAGTTPVITATLVPTLTVEVTPTPTPSSTPTLTPTDTPPPPTETAIPETTPLVEEIEEGPQRYREGDSDVAVDWGMLFDSVALAVSYLWLGCGVLIFMAIPVVFAVLWVAGKRRQQPPE
jgi:hypothetical protein